jgi:hypothetical protein
VVQPGSILQRARRNSPEARAAAAVCFTLFAMHGGRLPVIVGAGLVDAMLLAVLLWPNSLVTRALHTRCGPSLDVAQMNRRECFRASGGFLLLSISSLAIMLGSEWAGGVFDPPFRGTQASPPLLQFWYALWGFFFFMAFVAAVYLLLRAPFRPARPNAPAPRAW